MKGLHQIDIVNGKGVFVGFVRVFEGEAELLLGALGSVGGDDVEIGMISGVETAVVVKREWIPHTPRTAGERDEPIIETVGRLQYEAVRAVEGGQKDMDGMSGW